MKAIKNIVSILFLVSTTLIFGQLDLSFKAEKLSEAINSEYSECAAVFAPNGERVYFLRINHPDNRFGKKGSQDIWVSEYKNGTWQTATRLPDEVNLGRYNSIFGITPVGDLLISGVYDKRGGFVKRGMSKVVVNASINTYSTPEPVKMKRYARKSKGEIASATIDASGARMFLSFSKRSNSRRNNLYVSELIKTKWSKPRKLKKVNTPFNSEESPFINFDASEIYFSSNKGNEKDNFDIYTSQIADINEYTDWSEPVKVAGDISGSGYDGFFSIDRRGEYAYFTSQRNGDKTSDIYRVQIKDIRDQVLVRGFVLNSDTRQILEYNTPFALEVYTKGTIGQSKKVEIRNFKMIKDSSYFEFEIPFGLEYELKAIVDNYEIYPVVMDFSKIGSYQVVKQNAKAKPVPILTLSGKIEFSDPKNANYDSTKIYANGELVNNAKINNDGTYSLELPSGKLYKIEARRASFVTFPKEVDVTKSLSKVSRSIDLKLEAIPDVYSYLIAQVKSKKDSSFIDKSIYQVYVNGFVAPEEMITKNTEGFELKLEMGRTYFIMVKSSNYIEAHDSLDFRKAKIKEKIKSEFLLTPIEVGATVQIKNIYFDLGKATLKSESFIELTRLVELLTEHDHLSIEIGGHTDSKGNAFLNQKLSAERAQSVKDYLINEGKISSDRLESKGYGFSKPVSDNDTEENRAKNRRVEFTILSND